MKKTNGRGMAVGMGRLKQKVKDLQDENARLKFRLETRQDIELKLLSDLVDLEGRMKKLKEEGHANA